jgi:hypothetical protein
MHLVKQVVRELQTELVAHLVSFVRTCSVSQSSEFSQDLHPVPHHIEQVRNYLPVLLLLVVDLLLLVVVLLVVVVLPVLLAVLLVLSLHLHPFHHLY